MRPLTCLLVLCVCGISLSVMAALVCQNKQECKDSFSAPISGLCCVGCLVMLFALFYVEMGMGHHTGVMNNR